jgi:arylsulfatase A-like enzyme
LLRRIAPGGGDARGLEAKAFSVVWLPDAELQWGKRVRLSALRDGRYKLIRDYTRDRSMLFDLESDPGERADIAATQPEVAQRLRSVLEAWTEEQSRRGGAAHTVAVDAEEIRKLKELGYL